MSDFGRLSVEELSYVSELENYKIVRVAISSYVGSKNG